LPIITALMGRYLITAWLLLICLSLNAECSVEQTSQDCGCSATSRTHESSAVDDHSRATPTESATPPCASSRDEARTNQMARIDGETFVMGLDRPIIVADGEGPSRHVTVKTFWLDVHEVSNAEFRRFVDATGYVTEVSSYYAFTLHACTTVISLISNTKSVIFFQKG